MQPASISWQPWHYQTAHGFTLRGQYTPPRGLPVLHFMHGNSYSGLTYLPLWQALHADFDIFLHDAQGHGDSDEGGPFVGWNTTAQLAVECAEQVLRPVYGQVPVYGCGHSFGGIVTLLMNQQSPALFNELLLLDPILFPRRMLYPALALSALGVYQLNPYAKRARRRRHVWQNREAALAGLQGRGMFKGWHADALQAYVDYAMHEGDTGQWQLKCSPQREAEIFSSYAHGLWPYLRSRLQTPVHVWVGAQSYPFVRKAVTRWQQHNDRLHLEFVTGGHCFMLEHPQQTAQRMRLSLPHAG